MITYKYGPSIDEARGAAKTGRSVAVVVLPHVGLIEGGGAYNVHVHRALVGCTMVLSYGYTYEYRGVQGTSDLPTSAEVLLWWVVLAPRGNRVIRVLFAPRANCVRSKCILAT